MRKRRNEVWNEKKLIPVAIAVTLCILAVSCGKGNTLKNIEVKIAGETDVSEDASTDTISTEETGKTDVSDVSWEVHGIWIE